jgi:hypothetical protein
MLQMGVMNRNVLEVKTSPNSQHVSKRVSANLNLDVIDCDLLLDLEEGERRKKNTIDKAEFAESHRTKIYTSRTLPIF